MRQAIETWAFTFQCVTEGSDKDEALRQAIEYMAEQFSKGEVGPTDAELLEARRSDYPVADGYGNPRLGGK